MTLSRPVVCFGAGSLGRRVTRAIQPVLICDNDSSLWQSAIDGVPIISPESAVRRYPDATFVIAIWNPSRTDSMASRVAQLKSLGALNVIPFTALLPEWGDLILPNLLWERPDYYAQREEEIATARSLFDERGSSEFERQMRLRSGDFLGQIIDLGVQYFAEDVVQLGPNEVFIDCGAYTGDTIGEFRRATGDRFECIVAFEPDAVNFAALRSATRGDRRIIIQPYAIGARPETLSFTINGVASHISSTGTCKIQVTTLDNALESIVPSYIKFDIEGSEPDALEGARQVIARHRPKLAVCVYHAPDHLWKIPIRLSELLPDSRFTLRTYAADGFECVCYCIPN